MEQLVAWLLSHPLWLLLAAFGVPAFMMRRIEKKLDAREEKRRKEQAEKEAKAEAREKAREKLDLLLIQEMTAVSTVVDATARAVQRIPDAHCNGDMSKALEYAASVKNLRKNFLTELGIHALHED